MRGECSTSRLRFIFIIRLHRNQHCNDALEGTTHFLLVLLVAIKGRGRAYPKVPAIWIGLVQSNCGACQNSISYRGAKRVKVRGQFEVVDCIRD